MVKECSSRAWIDRGFKPMLCTCGSEERNSKIWIDFRKSPRFSLTSPLSQVALFLLCVVSPGNNQFYSLRFMRIVKHAFDIIHLLTGEVRTREM
jgi:hypothetical protein